MKFIKLPTKIALNEEIEKADSMNLEIEWEEGFALVNVSEIQEVIQSTLKDECSIYYKSGDSITISLPLDDLATLLESK